MPHAADAQAPLEAVLKDEIIRMYDEVAEDPSAEFHFYHGREAAELFGYDDEWLLSFRKRRVTEEMYRVLEPGGRISITDIVSGRGVKAVMMTAEKPE